CRLIRSGPQGQICLQQDTERRGTLWALEHLQIEPPHRCRRLRAGRSQVRRFPGTAALFDRSRPAGDLEREDHVAGPRKRLNSGGAMAAAGVARWGTMVNLASIETHRTFLATRTMLRLPPGGRRGSQTSDGASRD